MTQPCLPPEILAFANHIRDEFGPGTKLKFVAVKPREESGAEVTQGKPEFDHWPVKACPKPAQRIR
jgi:hypothetical protein